MPRVLAIAGAALAAGALVADRLGVGSAPGFGLAQALGLLLGAALLAASGLARHGRLRGLLRSRPALAAVGLAIGLTLAELALRAGHPVVTDPPALDEAGALGIVADPELGQRMTPGALGHDARGYRNASALARADIVAIGDSQTWGYLARQDEAWPQVLARRIGRPVYNLGFSGYGPVEYGLQVEEALALTPRLLVVALYLGNDLADAYRSVYQRESCPGLRDPARVQELGTAPLADAELALIDDLEAWLRTPPARPSLGAELRRLLCSLALHRALVEHGLLRDRGWPRHARTRTWAEARDPRVVVHDAGPASVVLFPARTLLFLDLDEPRIAEGLRITEESLGGIHRRLAGTGIALALVAIPTRETIYAGAIGQRRALPADYARLLGSEARVRARLAAWSATHSATWIDPLPELAAEVLAGRPVAAAYLDGHLEAQGYAIVAATVQRLLGENHLLAPARAGRDADR